MTDWTAKPYIAPNTLHCVDAFELLAALPDASVDMCLTDMPYGTTACSWDTVIDLDAWWAEMRRVMKPRGAVVCTASQPFTTKLISSNYEWFREEFIWLKSNGGMFLNANRQHLKRHENVIVFADGLNTYNPQMSIGEPYRLTSQAAGETTQDQTVAGWQTINLGFRYPVSYEYFKSQTGKHPTQKPVALFEYLIKTYTNAGDLVIDPFVGSGTTAVAAHITGRRFICGDQSPEYIEIARRRVFPEFGKPPKRAKEIKPLTDLPLFEGLTAV